MTCNPPKLFFEEKFSIKSPKKVFQSTLFSISSIISFYCKTNFTYRNIWTLTQIDPNTFKKLSNIDLSTNPTYRSSELVFVENVLEYGLYIVQYQVTLTFNGNSQKSSNIAKTYFEIVPTGIVVYAIENGVSGVLIGTKQSFNLRPSVFSMDFDNIVQPTELAFKYFCKMVNLSDPNSLNIRASQIDLLSFANNDSLIMDRNLNCFGNNSN